MSTEDGEETQQNMKDGRKVSNEEECDKDDDGDKRQTEKEVSVEEQDKAVTAAVRIRTQAREYESDRKDTQTTYWPLYLRSFFFTCYPNASEHKFATSKKISRLLVKVEPSSRTPLIMHLTV